MTGRPLAGTLAAQLRAQRPQRLRLRQPARRLPAAPASEGEGDGDGNGGTAKKRYFTRDQARAIAAELGIDFGALGCGLEQFRMGLGVELEHGPRDTETDVSGNDPIVTGKIALAHLTEFPDYYTRLAVLEREAAVALAKK